MTKIEINGKNYIFHTITGDVVASDKRSETRVHGSGNQYGVSISSTTTVYNEFFLKDVEGNEHSFQLSDFDIASREGHELSVVWLIKEGAEKGPYVIVYNHDTDTAYFSKKSIIKLYKRPNEDEVSLTTKLLAVIFILFTMGFGLIVLLVYGVYDSRRAKKKYIEFKKSDEVNRVISDSLKLK